MALDVYLETGRVHAIVMVVEVGNICIIVVGLEIPRAYLNSVTFRVIEEEKGTNLGNPGAIDHWLVPEIPGLS